jgi:CRP-like cAMP-binding protein
MLDQIRPCLLPTAEVRKRSDGTEGICDPETGHSYETTPEQANLIQLFDGQRSLLEISAEYMNRHGFVPFAAIDELMWGLVDAGLLMNPPRNLDRLGSVDRSSWVDLLTPTTRFRFKGFWPTPMRALELLLWPALAAYVAMTVPENALSPLDVLFFFPGVVVGLTLRERFKAACVALAGAPPKRSQIVSLMSLIWFVVPDAGSIALLNRRQRVVSHVGALFGAATALALLSPQPGLRAGALMVLLFDLCPLVQSSMESILSAMSGQPHLREHLRTFVGLPLFSTLMSLNPSRRSGPFLLFAGLFSTLWLGMLFFVIFGIGFPTAIHFIEIGGKVTGFDQLLAGAGVLILFSICPLPLVLSAFQLIESAFTTLWPRETGGKQDRGAADLASFRSIPLFSKLPDADLKTIAAASREVSYGAGELIVEEGAPGNTFCSIRRGLVSVTRGEKTQQPRVVARLSTGDCFGETAMLKDGVRTATIRAVTETVVIELSTEAFEKIVAKIGGVDFAAVLRAANAIGKSKLFKELPPERLSSLASKFVPRSIPNETNVVTAGEPGHEFFLIAKGTVDVLAPDGKFLVKLGDGDVFGEIALLKNVPRTATVRTTSETLMLVLSRQTFLQALHADLALSARVEEIANARAARDVQPQAVPTQ